MKQILFILLFVIGISIDAQPPSKFHCRYGGSGYDVGYDVKQTLDNGYIITGSTSSFGQGNTDLYLLKLDSMGQVKFQTSFGGYSNDIGKSVIVLADSGFIMVGYTSSTGIGGYDIFLVKADKNGVLEWQKTIGGGDWDFAHSLQATSDGGFIIAGTTYSFGYGSADGYVVKIDAFGNVQWSKTYGGKKDDEFKSVIQTIDGNYALAGYTKSYADSLGDAWIFKIDAAGDSIFSRKIGGNYEDGFNNVIQLPNNNLYFVGYNKSQTNGSNSINWQYSIDNSSIVVLNNFIGNTNIERYNCSAVNIKGMVVSVGFNNYLGTSSDANIHVFNPDLSYYVYYPFGLEEKDELFSISPTKDKGFVGVGICFGSSSELNDILFVKTDSLGAYGASIVGIKENNSEKVDIRLFPNPVSKILNIDLPIYENKNLTYNLISINGMNIFSGGLSENKNIIDISTFNLSNGLYFIEIYDSKRLITKSKISIIHQE
ncbi:MAG: T9SS type A sorting domain-containing protein [Bacteroidota bacterium]